MENKIIFREVLSEIKKKADENGNWITKEEIRRMLQQLPLAEEHFQLIYDYLAQQNIFVTETREEAGEYPEEKEQLSLSLYIEEMERLSGDASEDELELMLRVMRGEPDAEEQLTLRFLPVICGMAGEYEENEIPAEDLIQEGNLGLLTALQTLREYDSPAACRAHILNSIAKAMQEAVDAGSRSRKMDQGIVSRVNHLNEAVRNLEQDLEHKVSEEELSAYLEMPLEEIRDILRMSGDQIELDKGL